MPEPVYQHDLTQCDCEGCRRYRRYWRAYYDARGRPDLGPQRKPFEGRIDEIIQEKCETLSAGDKAR